MTFVIMCCVIGSQWKSHVIFYIPAWLMHQITNLFTIKGFVRQRKVITCMQQGD